MPELLIDLEKWGADVSDTLHRLLDDSAFYLSLLKRFPEDTGLRKMKEGMRRADYPYVYEGVHQLKGSASTLGLIPIVDASVRVTDSLKSGQPSPAFEENYRILTKRLDECIAILTRSRRTNDGI